MDPNGRKSVTSATTFLGESNHFLDPLNSSVLSVFWLKFLSSNTNLLSLDSLAQLDVCGCEVHEDGQGREQDKAGISRSEAICIVRAADFLTLAAQLLTLF